MGRHVDRRNRLAAVGTLVGLLVVVLVVALIVGATLVGLAGWANGAARTSPDSATVTRTRAPVRVTTYNTLFTRPATPVHRELVRLSRRSDVMLLQETRRPAWVTHISGFRVLRWQGPGGGAPILFRGSRFRLVAAGSALSTWRPFHFDTTWARLVDKATGQSLVVASFHGVPHVEVRGRPRDNVRAHVNYPASMVRMRALVGRRAGPLIVGGDWNVDAQSDRRVRWSGFPARMAARARLTVTAPARGTLGGRTVDYMAARGLTPVAVRVGLDYRSDHRPVTVTYR